jgi:hypothetical protein
MASNIQRMAADHKKYTSETCSQKGSQLAKIRAVTRVKIKKFPLTKPCLVHCCQHQLKHVYLSCLKLSLTTACSASYRGQKIFKKFLIFIDTKSQMNTMNTLERLQFMPDSPPGSNRARSLPRPLATPTSKHNYSVRISYPSHRTKIFCKPPPVSYSFLHYLRYSSCVNTVFLLEY